MKPEWVELFEQYSRGELTTEAQTAFEQDINASKEMAEAFVLYKSIEEEMRFMIADEPGRNALGQTLKLTGKKYFTTTKPSAGKVVSINVKRFILAAVAILIISFAGYYFFFTHKDAQQLYAQYAQFENLSAQRAAGENNILNRAIYLYNTREYKSAIPLLQQYLQKDSSDTELVLALNISRLQTGLYDDALAGFSRTEAAGNAFKYQASWFKALLFLKKGDIKNSRHVLQSIPAAADTYSKAQQLLSELK